MLGPHPHAEATYNVNTLNDGTFAVEVAIREREPTKVSGFETEAKVAAWIERHKANVATGSLRPARRCWGRGGVKPWWRQYSPQPAAADP